jgi:rubrerythrin
MSISGNIEAILDFAIEQEIKANKFYLDLADKVENPALSQALKVFAAEEQGHREKLEQVKSGAEFKPSDKKIPDLKIADYVVDVEEGPNLSYQGILVMAMKKEKAAFKLYSDMAQRSDDERIKETFEALAQEEAKHKLRFELEYDQEILKED